MMKKILLPFFIPLLFSGCFSKPPSVNSTSLVSSDRVYDSSVLQASTDKAKLTFTRDTGFFYSGCAHDIYVNNKKTFKIKNGETITLNLPPEEYLIRLEISTPIFRKVDVTTTEEVVLRKGDSKEYRIVVSTSKTAQVRLVRMK